MIFLRGIACLIVLGQFSTSYAITPSKTTFRLRVTVTTPLEYQNVPLDPEIDFGKLLQQANQNGQLDPNSIQVYNLATEQLVPHAASSFTDGNHGRIEWVAVKPQHTEYEIRFSTTDKPSLSKADSFVPLIGTGDLLRYNANQPRPITTFYSAGLVDLTSNGQKDLVGCWNYAYRPGEPWSGAICYPRSPSNKTQLLFGDLSFIQQVATDQNSKQPLSSSYYIATDFADFNQDGRIDVVQTDAQKKAASFFLSTAERQANGLPIFELNNEVKISSWQACRAVDLDRDGALDLVVDGEFIRNANPDGWPWKASSPLVLDAGQQPCFIDLDLDGHLDSVCLQGEKSYTPDGYRIAWRRNLGDGTLSYAPEQPISGIDLERCSFVAVAQDNQQPGLLIQHDVFQSLSYYEQVYVAGESPRFVNRGRLESASAVMSLSDQAWPCLCDWDDDGDIDLLVGGGYGWPRIVINEGTNTYPRYSEPELILADEKPIRLLRNEILGHPNHDHNMGYSYPVFVDWDDDKLPDLILPNETNRIFWYKNVGTRKKPKFETRQQILVDGYPDSPEARKLSAKLALQATYPLEKNRPFFWRTGAAIADFNGDRFMDLVTLTGDTRQLALFSQYRDNNQQLRLKKDRLLRLEDGRVIDDKIVSRNSHWTESFRPVDWNSDGLVDLMYSLAGSHGGIQDGGSIYLLLNCGSKTEPKFKAPQTMRCFGEPIRVSNHGPSAWPGDIDGDGQPDLVACVEWSVYPTYRHAALRMKTRPTLQIGPLEVISE